ncbi:putative mediator of RNA polymerase II transcription subunit 26 [Fopius arisanus]|uniref:Mediator of RNA polymerase II transcription subunit 26 n=1 Tax=Fopius arisanus TaxID=64838 RepID=A0A0C9S010_9HYME|nr:PREDICTED: putative mediator of RNA polymerase II transcription subunit 26 [Fopius arisanus]
MKAFSWIPWLLVIFICMAEARYKVRRPLPPPPPPPPQIYKKSWPIGHRVSMGNTVHINSNNNYPPKRPLFGKPQNFRRPMRPTYNAPPASWKNPMPLLSAIPNIPVHPQRQPIKEFQLMSKVPEYSPEYRPEPMVMPPTHRGGIDDDKGPIHTIPAPNLSLADKPYNPNDGTEHEHEDNRRFPNDGQYNNPASGHEDHRRFPHDGEYNPNVQVTNYGYGTLMTSVSPQRPVTSPTPTQNVYEVTETNEINFKDYQTVAPTYYTPDFDPSRISTGTSDIQSNELYLNHPQISRAGVVGTNIQFGQSNVPMQTNLHSSLHVGFPGTGQGQQQSGHVVFPGTGQAQQDIRGGQQAPDLHVGHPAAAGPPLSATQLYDLLNSFPQSFDEQYAGAQQPQLQQHLQQQLGQLFQAGVNPTAFSQPQMHSFNYDEQANKRLRKQQQQQLQQQVLVGQDYASGRVTAGYNLQPEQTLDVRNNPNVNQDSLGYQHPEPSAQAENNIDYDTAIAATSQNQNNYFGSSGGDDNVATSFYTTLPNREAAEKLAALAAAGNVNSQLMEHIRKQQKKQESEEAQGDEPLPSNHRIEYQVSEQLDDVPREENPRGRFRFGSQKYSHRQQIRQQQIKQEQEKADKHYEQQQPKPEEEDEEEKPLRIMVPEMQEKNPDEGTSVEKSVEDYDYDSIEPENSKSTTSNDETYENSSSEFGTRISGKNEK